MRITHIRLKFEEINSRLSERRLFGRDYQLSFVRCINFSNVISRTFNCNSVLSAINERAENFVVLKFDDLDNG